MRKVSPLPGCTLRQPSLSLAQTVPCNGGPSSEVPKSLRLDHLGMPPFCFQALNFSDEETRLEMVSSSPALGPKASWVVVVEGKTGQRSIRYVRCAELFSKNNKSGIKKT